jgi:hypothetical protein
VTEAYRPHGPHWLVPLSVSRGTVADRTVELRARANRDACNKPAPPSARVVRRSLVHPSHDVSLPALRFLGQVAS